jgi:hypothetical protein
LIVIRFEKYGAASLLCHHIYVWLPKVIIKVFCAMILQYLRNAVKLKCVRLSYCNYHSIIAVLLLKFIFYSKTSLRQYLFDLELLAIQTFNSLNFTKLYDVAILQIMSIQGYYQGLRLIVRLDVSYKYLFGLLDLFTHYCMTVEIIHDSAKQAWLICHYNLTLVSYLITEINNFLFYNTWSGIISNYNSFTFQSHFF